MRKSGQTVLFFPRFQSEIIFITHQRRGDKSPTFWHANDLRPQRLLFPPDHDRPPPPAPESYVTREMNNFVYMAYTK